MKILPEHRALLLAALFLAGAVAVVVLRPAALGGWLLLGLALLAVFSALAALIWNLRRAMP